MEPMIVVCDDEDDVGVLQKACDDMFGTGNVVVGSKNAGTNVPVLDHKINVGTIGHVDHSKVSLCDAVTRVMKEDMVCFVDTCAVPNFIVDYKGEPVVRQKGKNKRWPRKW